MFKRVLNTKFFIYLLLLNIITLVFLNFKAETSLNQISYYSNKFTPTDYDSKSTDKKINEYKEFNEKQKPSPLKDIEISFKATVYSVTGNENIFQTAPDNSGIRMELSKPGKLGLVIQYNNKEKFVGREILSPPSNPLILNRPYDFKIKLNKNNILKVYVNGDQVLPSHLQAIPNTNYEMSSIAVGTGFNKTRPFNGKIENFSIKYNYYKTDSKSTENILAFPSITFFLILLGIVWTWKFNKPIEYFKKKISPKEILKFEYYPFLIASFPIFFILSNNVDKVVFFDFIYPLFFSLIITIILYLSFNLLFTHTTSAIIICIFLIYFYSAGHAYNLVKSSMGKNDFLYIFSIIFITLLFIFTESGIKNKISRFFKTISFALIIISFINIAINLPVDIILKTDKSAYPKQKVKNGETTNTKLTPKSNPDIYYIILDAYANNWTLNKFLSYDNSEFLDYLERNEFYIAEKSTANYRLTPLSVGSSLNMEYFSEKIESYAYLRDKFINNNVGKLLKERGYMYININPDGAIASTNPNAEINDNCNRSKEFSGILLQTTILFNTNFVTSDIHRKKVLCAFSDASNLISTKSPKFFYIHVLAPHWPYVFDKDGGYTPKDKQYDTGDQIISSSLNKDGYLNQLQFVNKKTKDLVGKILSESKSSPIIIIQSDHGPQIYLDEEINKGEKMPQDEMLKARMRNLSAFYLPDGGNEIIPENITPVNIFRYIFNYYFEKDFEILDNKNYYSPNEQPFNFTDVTTKVEF